MILLPRLLSALALLTSLALAPLVTRAAPQPAPAYLPGELIVRLQPGSSLAAGLAALPASVGAPRAERIGPDLYRLTLAVDADLSGVARRLAISPAVRYAQPNYLRRILRTPNDPALDQQWALRNIQAFDAWDITTGGEVVIAVVDTGVSRAHPDLRGKVLPGYNAIAESGDTEDDNGHGTAVAGLIAANTNNGAGVAGLCWGCRILPIKALNAFGSGDDASVARGIRWAADNGARVINMSLGGSDDSPILREAVDYALGRGVLIIASSGNERQEGNAPNFPAAYPGVVAVGATGNTDVVTGFSNTGDYVDIAAPGVGLWTTIPGGGYGPPNGTSFSSPYVAGAAGLVLTVRGDLGPADLACVLEASADDKGAPGKDPEYGWGRLNVLRAVQLAQSYGGCPLVPPAPQPAAPQPAVPQPAGGAPAAFAGVPPQPTGPELSYFPETQHSLRGEFKRYWERNGGLPIFGFPISEEFVERGDDGRDYVVQYFERHRFEFHPENPPPYNVQLSRLGDQVLRVQGRDWFSFPKTGPQPGCVFFEATGHAVCGAFLSFWRASGLEFDGRPGKSFAESLALFGQPISSPQAEEVAPGVMVTVQWFERARFEDHGGVLLLGLLSSDLARSRGWR